MDLNEIKFDYYANKFSHIKFIMELLVKNGHNTNEMFVVKEIMNNILNDMDEEELHKLLIYSSLFENRVLMMTQEKRNELVEYLYSCYIKSMIVNFSNNDLETTKVFYNLFDEKVKELSGFYGIYGDDSNSIFNKKSL